MCTLMDYTTQVSFLRFPTYRRTDICVNQLDALNRRLKRTEFSKIISCEMTQASTQASLKINVQNNM